MIGQQSTLHTQRLRERVKRDVARLADEKIRLEANRVIEGGVRPQQVEELRIDFLDIGNGFRELTIVDGVYVSLPDKVWLKPFDLPVSFRHLGHEGLLRRRAHDTAAVHGVHVAVCDEVGQVEVPQIAIFRIMERMVLGVDENPEFASDSGIRVELPEFGRASPRLHAHENQVDVGPGQDCALHDGGAHVSRKVIFRHERGHPEIVEETGDPSPLLEAVSGGSEQDHDQRRPADLRLQPLAVGTESGATFRQGHDGTVDSNRLGGNSTPPREVGERTRAHAVSGFAPNRPKPYMPLESSVALRPGWASLVLC